MKVTFRQSGGVAGLVRGCTVDTEQLPAEERARLLDLLEKSRLLAGPASRPGGSSGSSRARDLMQYEIRIEERPEGAPTLPGVTAPVTAEFPRLEATFDDSTLPEAARPFLHYLKSRARPIPPD